MGLERTPLALSAADDVVIVPDDVVIATEEIIYESVALSLDESEVKQELVEEKAEEVKQEAENIQQASAAAESTSEKVTTEFFSSPDYSPSPAIMALAMSPLNSPIGMLYSFMLAPLHILILTPLFIPSLFISQLSF